MSPAEREPASKLDVVATLAIVLSCVALVLAIPIRRRFAAHPSAEACAELVERWAEHSARQNDPDLPASVVAARRAQARARSWTIARCTSELTEAEARCAKDAHSADEFERCVQ